MKKFRISLHFYRSMMPFCILITLACGWILGSLMDTRVIPLLIFFKVSTLVLFFFFTLFLQPREFYYYYNLGISRWRLWLTAAAVDLPVFVGVIVLTYILFVR